MPTIPPWITWPNLAAAFPCSSPAWLLPRPPVLFPRPLAKLTAHAATPPCPTQGRAASALLSARCRCPDLGTLAQPWSPSPTPMPTRTPADAVLARPPTPQATIDVVLARLPTSWATVGPPRVLTSRLPSSPRPPSMYQPAASLGPRRSGPHDTNAS
jgi:hypothetical protein